MPAACAPAMDRDCPRCFVPLEQETRDALGPDVTVDICPECDGEFLDEGEIKRLTRDRDLHKLLTDHLARQADSDLVCPSCGGLMDAEMLDVGDTEVEVDVCMACHGLWLDDGELAKIEAADTDFGELSEEKLAEIWDAEVSGRRRKGLLGKLLGGLRRRR